MSKSSDFELLRLRDLAALLKISLRSACRLRAEELICPPVIIRGCVRWVKEDVMRWVKQGCPPAAEYKKLGAKK